LQGENRKTFRLRQDQMKQIDKLQKAMDLNDSEVVRFLLDLALSNYEGKKISAVEGFAAGWLEARFEAAGLVKKAVATTFAVLNEPPKRGRS
jgi:hypothetical protein